MRTVLLLSCLLFSGCFPVADKDRPLWLEGHVYSPAGEPLSGVVIYWDNMQLASGPGGCFFLGGHFPEKPLRLAFLHPDYASLEAEQAFGHYRLAVTLADKEDPSLARTDWEQVTKPRRPGCQ